MKKKKLNIKQWLKAFGFALLTVIFIKSFLFWVYVVPSTSMEKALLPGDLILVNKMSYGLRLPITPLTFPLSHQKMPFSDNLNSFWDIIEIPYVRLFASKIERNDVVVFNYPMDEEMPLDHRSFYIKRCIGLPGETIAIDDKKVLINDTLIDSPEFLAFDYKVKSSEKLTIDTLQKYNITEGRANGDNWYQLTLSEESKQLVNNMPYVEKIKPLNINKNNYADYIFPFNPEYKWNIDFFGPLLIPAKDMKVTLTHKNVSFYKRIIETYEDNELDVLPNAFVVNGDTVSSYTFKLDYYFMMGDNRHNSSDSRFWGFVPESHIVGKATSVLFSVNKASNALEKYRWDRFFSGIE